MFSAKQCSSNRIAACRSFKLNPYLLPCTKPNSGWIKDLIGSDTLNLIEKKVGNRLEFTGPGKDVSTEQ